MPYEHRHLNPLCGSTLKIEKGLQGYFDTFHACWSHARNVLNESIYSSSEFEDYLHTGGVPYGGTWSSSFYLETKKGNLAKKCLQVSITRLSSGQYDCTAYIL